MSAIALQQPHAETRESTRNAVRQTALALVVLGVIWGLWEGWRWLGIQFGITFPFEVSPTSMPHIHSIVKALFEPSRIHGPLLISLLAKSALFTAKEAATGFALGASVGFLLGVVLAHSRLLQRGFLPYIVASQTVPILAIAPMV